MKTLNFHAQSSQGYSIFNLSKSTLIDNEFISRITL